MKYYAVTVHDSTMKVIGSGLTKGSTDAYAMKQFMEWIKRAGKIGTLRKGEGLVFSMVRQS